MNIFLIILYVLLSIIGLIVIYIVGRLLFDTIKIPYYKHLCKKSYSFVNEYVGHYSIVTGSIGAGKTTFASGYTNYRTIYKMQQAQDKINEIMIKFHDVDFNRINEFIEKLYKYGDSNFDHITNDSYISAYILNARIHPDDENDKRIYDDIFGGPIVYEKTKSHSINKNTYRKILISDFNILNYVLFRIVKYNPNQEYKFKYLISSPNIDFKLITSLDSIFSKHLLNVTLTDYYILINKYPINEVTYIDIYIDEDNKLIDKDGFILDNDFKKIVVYDDIKNYKRDKNGVLIFDKTFNPIIDNSILSDEEQEDFKTPKRSQVFVDNGLSYVDGYTMLRDYIKAYLALVKNNYVYFLNRNFYNRITHNYALDFDEKLTDIKDSFIQKNYRISNYSILFWDEVALTDKKNTNFQQVAKHDGGTDAFLRLVRQIGKGTIDVIKTVQKFGRVVLSERELVTSVIDIKKRKEHIISKFKFEFLTNLITFFSRIVNNLSTALVNLNQILKSRDARYLKKRVVALKEGEKLTDEDILKYYRLKERYELKESKLRKLLNKLVSIRDKIYASSLIEYQGVIYLDYEAVGKSPSNMSKNEGMKFNLYYPIQYCYGSCDTYAYSIVGDYLSLRSINHMEYAEDSNKYPESIKSNREIFVTKILTKDGVKSIISNNQNEDVINLYKEDKKNKDKNIKGSTSNNNILEMDY